MKVKCLAFIQDFGRFQFLYKGEPQKYLYGQWPQTNQSKTFVFLYRLIIRTDDQAHMYSSCFLLDNDLPIQQSFVDIIVILQPGSCASELQQKVNSRLKVNCRIKFGLAPPTFGRPAQMFSHNSLSVSNSLSAAIHLYTIQPYVCNMYLTIFFRKTSSLRTLLQLHIFSAFLQRLHSFRMWQYNFSQ